MWIKSLTQCVQITAGDGTALREIVHPDRDGLPVHFSLAHARLSSGHWSLLHVLTASELYYVLAGHGLMEIDGQQREIGVGDTVHIPKGAAQRAFSLGPLDLEFICIVDPPWRAEDEQILQDG